MMIVDQGTLLDRVDQNLVAARENTQEAVKELVKACSSSFTFTSPLLLYPFQADKHDRAAQMKLCILFLVIFKEARYEGYL